MNEAISTQTAAIISYHPPIFKPLSSFTLTNPLQKSLLLCAAHGISVFSPHTALDRVNGGINDWLCDVVRTDSPGSVEYIRAPKEGELNGQGRLVRFEQPMELDNLVSSIKKGLVLSAGKCPVNSYSSMTIHLYHAQQSNLADLLTRVQTRSHQWLYAPEVVVLCCLVSTRMSTSQENCPMSVYLPASLPLVRLTSPFFSTRCWRQLRAVGT